MHRSQRFGRGTDRFGTSHAEIQQVARGDYSDDDGGIMIADVLAQRRGLPDFCRKITSVDVEEGSVPQRPGCEASVACGRGDGDLDLAW